jgi:hypothetical protein
MKSFNQWNYDTIFTAIHLVDKNPHAHPEYTLTIVDYEKIEEKLSASDFSEAKQIIQRVK